MKSIAFEKRRNNKGRLATRVAALAVALASLALAEPRTAWATDGDIPDGFRGTKWGMGIDQVKQAIVQEDQVVAPDKTQEHQIPDILAMERLEDCPIRKEKPCLSLKVRPADRDSAYKEAEYYFNPFTDKILRIVIKYKGDYGEIDKKFTEMWGAPTEKKTTKLEAQSFFPEGQVLDKVWRKGRTAVTLHYTLYPSQSGTGYVEFADADEKKTYDFLADQYKKLGEEHGQPEEKKSQPPSGPPEKPLF